MTKLVRGFASMVVVMCGLTFTSIAWGQVSNAQNKLLAKRAAEADGYRKLAETVYGVQLNSNTYVRDFVAESDEIRTSVNHFIKGIRFGTPRYYDDGVCEVDAEVTVAKLVTHLKKVYTSTYRGNHVSTTDIENITQRIKRNVIRVTGSGAPRPELPPGLPEGFEEVLTPLPAGISTSRMSVPAIWKTIPPQARLMAPRAARVDAMRRLLEEIKGLRLNSNTLVRDFITETDEISARASGLVVGASEVSTYLHDDELIAEVVLEVPLAKVVTRITELHKQHYHGNHVSTTDIVNVKKNVVRSSIRAVGSGVAPSRFQASARQAGYQTPRWFTERIEVFGEGTDPEIGSTVMGRLRAARAATLDGMRKLAENAYGLRIDSNTTVRDFVAENDDISTQLQAVLRGATTDEPVFESGVARIRVSMPAAEVWTVVNQQSLIVSRRK